MTAESTQENPKRDSDIIAGIGQDAPAVVGFLSFEHIGACSLFAQTVDEEYKEF